VSDWFIGIDFGTTRSAGAMAEVPGSAAIGAAGSSGGVRVSSLEVEGNRWIPSTVVLSPAGELLVGAAAEQLAGAHPDRLERTPKSALGLPAPLLLGGTPVDARDAVAAVLGTLVAEGTLRSNGRPPAAAVLAHPVRWADSRRDALADAARRAGLTGVSLVEEPVAAAVHYAAADLAHGSHVAVYDLGGGTFDTAILQRTDDGFEVVGVPGGDEGIGGERFDHLLFSWFGEHLAESAPDVWDQLRVSDERPWRHAAFDLRAQARRAKEALSSYTSTQVFVPSADVEILVNRSQFEAMIVDDVERTVEVLADTIATAGLRPADLAAVYLVGGSSRIPLVVQLVAEHVGAARVTTRDEPKSVVSLGAARLAASRGRATSPGASPPRIDTTPSVAASPAPTIAAPGLASLRPPTLLVRPPLAAPTPAAPAAATMPVVPQVNVAWRTPVPAGTGQMGSDRHGVVIGDRDGVLRGIDGATGGVRWQTRIGTAVWAPPALTDDLVVAGGLDGRVVVVDRATGAIRWSAVTGAPIGASPAITATTVMVGNDAGTVFGFDRASGVLRWQLPVGAAVRAGLVSTGSGAVVATVTGQVFHVDGASGTCRWGYVMASAALAAPAVVAGRVLVPSDGGIVYGLSLADGTAIYGVRCTGRCVTGIASSQTAFALVDEGGVLRVHRGDTGQVISEITLAGAMSAGVPAGVAAGVVLAPSASPRTAVADLGGELVAVDLAAGSARFSVPTGAGNRSAPVITGGLVVACTTFGQLLGIVVP